MSPRHAAAQSKGAAGDNLRKWSTAADTLYIEEAAANRRQEVVHRLRSSSQDNNLRRKEITYEPGDKVNEIFETASGSCPSPGFGFSNSVNRDVRFVVVIIIISTF